MSMVDVDLLEQWLCTDVYPCVDDVRHARGISGHTLGALAFYRIWSPCCGPRGEVCKSRGDYLQKYAADIRCNACGKYSDGASFSFYPLSLIT